jgi:hypothetical protein
MEIDLEMEGKRVVVVVDVGDGGPDDGRSWQNIICLAVVSVPRGSWLGAAKGHVRLDFT